MSDTVEVPERTSVQAPDAEQQAQTPPVPDIATVVESDVLVEDVSIDGMCGVY